MNLPICKVQQTTRVLLIGSPKNSNRSGKVLQFFIGKAFERTPKPQSW
jgi:hypothetical protein